MSTSTFCWDRCQNTTNGSYRAARHLGWPSEISWKCTFYVIVAPRMNSIRAFPPVPIGYTKIAFSLDVSSLSELSIVYGSVKSPGLWWSGSKCCSLVMNVHTHWCLDAVTSFPPILSVSLSTLWKYRGSSRQSIFFPTRVQTDTGSWDCSRWLDQRHKWFARHLVSIVAIRTHRSSYPHWIDWWVWWSR